MRHRIGYKTGLVAIEFNPNIHAEHNAKVILSQLQVVLYSNPILPTNVNTLFRGEVQVANIAHINTLNIWTRFLLKPIISLHNCYSVSTVSLSASQSRVGKSSIFLIFPQFPYFSSNVPHFSPHFGPSGGRVAHPGKPIATPLRVTAR